MDADGLPVIGAGIDFTKVDSIPPKRSLACINHFIMHTVSFLNRFSCICEEKLEDLTTRIQRLETTVSILEAKLSSIPGLDGVTTATSAQSQTQPTSSVVTSQHDAANSSSKVNMNSSTDGSAATNGQPPPTSDSIPNGDESSSQGATSAVNDPRYAKFFTLIKHGVPKQAVVPKMLLEGLDPSVLDNPSAAVLPQTPVATSTQSEEKKDSDLSDSDDTSDSLSGGDNSDEDLDD